MSDRVPAFDRLGNPITVPVEQLPELQRMGGRAATGEEIAKARSDEAYAQKSTAEKITSLGSVIGPVPFAARAAVKLAQGKGAEIAPSLPPEMEAYAQGVSQGFAGGLPTAAMHEAVKVAGGAGAAKAYAQTVSDVTKGHPNYETAGQVVGLAGAVGGPGVSTVGNIAQRGAAAIVGEGVGRGILTRALSTAAELGVRGAAEGALLGGAQQITEDSLGDKDLVADKIFAHMGMGALGGAVAGAALGGLGSAGLSGVKKGGSALLRVVRPAEEVAAGRAEKAAELAEEAGAKAAAKPEAGPLERVLGGDATTRAQQTANELAVDSLGATKGQVVKALENVKGGRQALGEFMNRELLNSPADESVARAAWNALRNGRADELLPRIQAVRAETGKAIGEALTATPSKMSVEELKASAERVLGEMYKDPTRIGGAEAFAKSTDQAYLAMRNSGAISADGTIDTARMYAERARMEGAAYEVHSNLPAQKAWKEWLRDVDRLTLDATEKAAQDAGPSNVRETILGLKRKYQLAVTAEDLAQHGTDRILGNNIIGLREGIGLAVGAATGHAIPAMASALIGKIARERGAATTATLLTKLADMGTVAKLVRETDAQITRASRGLLTKPKAIAGPASDNTPVRTRAAAIIARVAAVQADPAAHAERAQRATEGLAQNAPNVAGTVQARQIQALTLLASKIPVHPDPDPLDPHPAPPLTDAQAAELVRYERYIEKPMRFFEDLERGKITFEGAEVARELVPRAFEQLRMETLENLATLRAKGTLVPYNQRRQLGILIDAPTTPDQRPEHARFLQANVQPTPQDLAKIQGNAPSPPKRPAQMKTQQSALDRLAAK